MGQTGKGEQQEWETSESNERSKTAFNYLYTQLNAYVSTHLSIDTNKKICMSIEKCLVKKKVCSLPEQKQDRGFPFHLSKITKYKMQ